MGNSHNLVIVESPSKAKTIGRYLGSDYIVKASMGHLRDLPKSKMGVDLENDFTPQYIAVRGKESLIKELKADAAKAEKMATELGCELCLCKPEEIASKLGSNSTLYAVDGLLPVLASTTGCRCTVLMAARAAERYPLSIGSGHRYVSNHTPCHPCHRSDCDQATPCTSGITVNDMLGA